MLAEAGSIPMSIAAWITGGVITLASALTVAEIARSHPQNWRPYIYLRSCMASRWDSSWLGADDDLPIRLHRCPGYCLCHLFYYFVPVTAVQRQILAVGVLLSLLAMNIISTPVRLLDPAGGHGGETAAHRVDCGLWLSAGLGRDIFHPAAPSGRTALALRCSSTLWAYDGWISVTNVAGELKTRLGDLPRGPSVQGVFVIATHLLFNLAIFRVLPMADIVASSTPAADAAVRIC